MQSKIELSFPTVCWDNVVVLWCYYGGAGQRWGLRFAAVQRHLHSVRFADSVPLQGCWISCPVGHRLRDQLPILTTTSLKQSAWYTETSVLRCGVRKPFLVQPFCLELSLAAVQKALQEGEAPVDSSVSVLQICELVGIWDALALQVSARCRTRELSRTGRSQIIGTFCKPKFGNFDGNGPGPGERCETKWRIFAKIHPNVRLCIEGPGTGQNFRFGHGQRGMKRGAAEKMRVPRRAWSKKICTRRSPWYPRKKEVRKRRCRFHESLGKSTVTSCWVLLVSDVINRKCRST